jgi:hypothetical protein
VYWPVGRAEFVDWDDPHTISQNPTIVHPTAESFRKIWTQPHMDLYVPLTYTAWWTVARLSNADEKPNAELSPRAFHYLNVIAHACTAVVVFAILRGLVEREWAAGVGSLLFAVHPVQVESVAWASGFKDVLGGLLCCVTLWLYLSFARRTSSSRWIIFACALLAMSLATLAKPIAMVVPLMALTLDVLALHRPKRAALISFAPLAALGLACAIWTKCFQPAPTLTTQVALHLRPLVALDAIAFYLWKLVNFAKLTHDYGRTPGAIVESGAIGFTWIVPLVVGVALWMGRRKWPTLVVGALLYLIALIPVLGLVPFDFQEFSTVADHYLYLPMVGVAFAVASLVARMALTRWKTFVLALVALGFMIGANMQTHFWLNTELLMRRCVNVNPNSWNANAILAAREIDKNNAVEAERLARRSVATKPDYAESRQNLGAALLQLGRAAEAVEQLETAVRLKPGLSRAHATLGWAYGTLGRLDDAIRAYEQAVRIDPNFAAARQILEGAKALREQQRKDVPKG